jgi:hypothetical protein
MASPAPRPVARTQTTYRLPFDLAATTTVDVTTAIDNISGRAVRIDRAWLSIPAGIVANASNFVVFKLIKGASTVIAQWSTATGVSGQGTITAATPINLVLTTAAARNLVDGDTLSLFVDVTGTITVPTGRLVATGIEL